MNIITLLSNSKKGKAAKLERYGVNFRQFKATPQSPKDYI